jgi:anti-sigma B factor antagonist
MRIEVNFNDDVAILSLSGRFLAGSDGPYLRQKVKDLIEAGTQKLILDFGDVPYIDSTGLGFLAGARVSAQNAGARIVLADLNPHVRKILDEVNLTQFFVVRDNEAAAMASLREAEAAPLETPKRGGQKRPSRSADV